MTRPPSIQPQEIENEQSVVALTLSLREWQNIPWGDRGITFENMENPRAWVKQEGKFVRAIVKNIYD